MDGVFIAWWKAGRRTRSLASALGLKVIEFRDRPPYLRAFRDTSAFLRRFRPSLVFLQLPQGPLLWCASRLKASIDFRLVADVHTAFLVYDSWKGWILNAPFRRLLRKTDLILIHNEVISELLKPDLRGKAVVVYDPLPKLPEGGDIPSSLRGTPYLVMPCSWHGDEPVEYVVSEFLNVASSLKLALTGGPRGRLPRAVKEGLREGSVVLTGYLSDRSYAALLRDSLAVIAATTREYTMLSTAWEAISLGKPLLVSETRTLKTVLGGAPMYFRVGVKGSLSGAISKLMSDKILVKELAQRISQLRGKVKEKVYGQLNTIKKSLSLGLGGTNRSASFLGSS